MIRKTLLLLLILYNVQIIYADGSSNTIKKSNSGNTTPPSNSTPPSGSTVPHGAIVPSGTSTPNPTSTPQSASTPDYYDSGSANMISDCANHPSDSYCGNFGMNDNQFRKMSPLEFIIKLRWELIVLIAIILSFIASLTAINVKNNIYKSQKIR